MNEKIFSKYTIIFSKKADKFLDSLDLKTSYKILKKIRELQDSNENLDIKKLKSKNNLYRLKVGNFRVIYNIQHERIVIYIIKIGHRKNVYQQQNFI